MSTTGMESSGHPITRSTGRIHQVLDGLADTPAWSMTPTEQRTALIELSRAESRILELRLRVLAAADHADIAADSGASSTAAWLAHATRRPRSRHAPRYGSPTSSTDPTPPPATPSPPVSSTPPKPASSSTPSRHCPTPSRRESRRWPRST